jgi:membrane-associated protease RseP (regulator of RpoE activity)
MIRCRCHPPSPRLPGSPRLLIGATCVLLAAACGTAAQAAPPDPPAPLLAAPRAPGARRVLLAHPEVKPVRRGTLGVELVEITPELREHFGAPRDAGVLVARVTPDGPAARAGVRVGDVITAVDGQKIGDDTDLRRQIRDKHDKEVAALEVLRNRGRQTVKAQIEVKETSELDLAGLIGRNGPRLLVDPVRINSLVDRALRSADMPELRERVERRREVEERLQQRTEALEHRLERLERELKERK